MKHETNCIIYICTCENDFSLADQFLLESPNKEELENLIKNSSQLYDFT